MSYTEEAQANNPTCPKGRCQITSDGWCVTHSTAEGPVYCGVCDCGHPSDDHDEDDACLHLCDCAWPSPSEGSKP